MKDETGRPFIIVREYVDSWHMDERHRGRMAG
jgi:hypothetical protein